eukprot:8627407-Prorocentrum_lima.AAC.1
MMWGPRDCVGPVWRRGGDVAWCGSGVAWCGRCGSGVAKVVRVVLGGCSEVCGGCGVCWVGVAVVAVAV